MLNLPAGIGGVISRFHYAHRSHEDAAYSGESRAGPILRAIKLWGHPRHVHGHAPVQEHRAAEGAAELQHRAGVAERVEHRAHVIRAQAVLRDRAAQQPLVGGLPFRQRALE